MNKYWAVFKVNWQKSFEYRGNFIGHMILGVITFFVMYFIWNAVFKGRVYFGTYTFQTMMTYVLMTKFLHFTSRSNVARDIGDEIKSGYLSSYLLKPVSYLRWWFSSFLADRSFELFLRLIMVLVFVTILPGIFLIPKMENFILFFLYIGLALFINFLVNIFIAGFAFWVTDVRLFRSTIIMVVDFLAGGLVPLDVMPDFLKKISLFLPFQYTTYFPIKIFQGSLSLNEVLSGIFISIIWSLFLSFFLYYIWRKGLKRYEAIGQ